MGQKRVVHKHCPRGYRCSSTCVCVCIFGCARTHAPTNTTTQAHRQAGRHRTGQTDTDRQRQAQSRGHETHGDTERDTQCRLPCPFATWLSLPLARVSCCEQSRPGAFTCRVEASGRKEKKSDRARVSSKLVRVSVCKFSSISRSKAARTSAEHSRKGKHSVFPPSLSWGKCARVCT